MTKLTCYTGIAVKHHDEMGKYYNTRNRPVSGAQTYDSMVAVSTNLFGPYGPRQCALRFGSHNSYFEDASGKLSATVWCYPDHDPHWQRVSIVPMLCEPEAQNGFLLCPKSESK